MKTIHNILMAAVLLISICVPARAQQNTLVSTTLSAAMTAGQTTIALASYTGVNAPSATVPASALYIIDPGQTVGELVKISKVVNSERFITRTPGNNAKAHVSGALVLVATIPSWFQTADPQGSCVTASTYVTPYLNTTNGRQWLCSTLTLTWVPGWGNTSAPGGVTAAVASAAGAIIPSGPFFHITGTAAITGFTLPLGFNSGSFCAINDGVWTWTTAGNILTAGTTTTAGSLNCFRWESVLAKWVPDSLI